MTSVRHATALARRVVAERRRLVTWLVAGFAINVVVYALGVYPLEQRVANVEERDRAAELELVSARADHDNARGTLTGKERAAKELATFYTSVLPADASGAQRLTYLRLARLATDSGLHYSSRSAEPVDERESSLTRYTVDMVLRGSYDAMRSFIYELEIAPEFVVIDDVSLAEAPDDRGALDLNLKLSTYFRTPGQ